MAQAKTGRENIASQIMRLAQSKLTFVVGQPPEIRKYSTTGRLAVADVRLCLDYEPQRSTNILDELVSQHMRHLYSVPAHREYTRSGYSSEPILAEVIFTSFAFWTLLTVRGFLNQGFSPRDRQIQAHVTHHASRHD